MIDSLKSKTHRELLEIQRSVEEAERNIGPIFVDSINAEIDRLRSECDRQNLISNPTDLERALRNQGAIGKLTELRSKFGLQKLIAEAIAQVKK